jgi:hypothetical protein
VIPREALEATAFYCVADARYFLGAVGMVNSLRLHGHREPVYVLDLGLEPDQRRTLSAEAEIVTGPGDVPPHLAKTVAPLAHPAETMVLIDCDMVVTRPLREPIEAARDGKVVAFRDVNERFVAEWRQALGLERCEPGPYVSSGLVAAGGEAGREVLEVVHSHRDRVDYAATVWGENDAAYPFRYADQDLLNAVLRCGFDDRLVALEHRLAPAQPYAGLRVRDPMGLRCAYGDDTEPYLVHHILPAKPWLVPGHEGLYTRLLRRALSGPGLAIELPPGAIPLRLRSGPLAGIERRRVAVAQQVRWRVGGFVRERLRPGAARSGGLG